MALVIDIPGSERLEIEVLLLDVNGTLSNRGELIDGVAERIGRLRDQLEVRLLSADTFGTVAATAKQLDVTAKIVADGTEKLAELHALGATRCAAIGNGTNDTEMLRGAALAIAIAGPEGASAKALAAADVVCRSVLEALDLLLEPRLLVATLRS